MLAEAATGFILSHSVRATEMTADLGSSSSSPSLHPDRRRLLAYVPPVRLLWMILAGLGAYGSFYLFGLGISSLVGVPLVAVVADLGFQRLRFPHVRFPDAAIATGLFLALIFAPTAPLLLTGSSAFAAVALRHAVRFRGRPWLNPAMSGAVLGSLVLGLVPAWWVGIGPYGVEMVAGLGLLLLLRDRRSWRLPATFLLTYSFLSVLQHLVVGASTNLSILLLLSFDPSTVFFAFFLVPEPRTAPRSDPDRVLYAGSIGVGAAVLPVILPSLGVFASLAAGNLLSVALRRRAALPTPASTDRPIGPGKEMKRTALPKPERSPRARSEWSIPSRVAVGILVLILLATVAGTSTTPRAPAPVVRVSAPPGGSGSGGVTTAFCTTDNPSVPSGTLTSLHHVLGPSVILSYDASSGVVVFYDPVNQVTVTESDLYEDYGFAEFNGDDYAVNGCSG